MLPYISVRPSRARFNVASSANIEYHARILAQKFLARQLISFASVIETKAFDETVDVEELMQEAEGSLFELSQRNMKKDYVQVDPVIAKAVEILQKASANNGGLTGVPTGYTKLDETTALGNLLNLRLYTGCELSYVTYGQNVPDDIDKFNPQTTVKSILGGQK